MGVPGFFRWICQRYPLIKRDFNDPFPPVINNLYIDINGLIHKAAATSNLQGSELTEDFLSDLYRFIDNQVQIMKPTDLIFISADGVAPFAKASQQRERRFVSEQDHVPNTFSHSFCSPGTEFMLSVHRKLIEFFENQKKNDFLWSRARVIYSGVTVPGEGEHKVINYIRENRSSPDWNPNLVHCIGEGDADLFFLALQTHEAYFVFFKSKETIFISKNQQVFDAKPIDECWSGDDYELIHVSLIREYLSLDFGVKGKELELMIDDFVALSFLLGNDFIPHIKDIDIHEIYDDILSVYKSIRKSSFNLIENNQFNKEFLKIFLMKVVELLRLRYKNEMKIEMPIEEVAKLYTQSNRQYLIEKFKVKEDELDELIKKMSNSMLDAFDWVLKYYREGCPSWRWVYPYHYAPPIEFIIPFIDDHKTVFDEDFPHPPLMQLLTILPPQAKYLLPKELADLMDSEELKPFYPETFEKDLNDRKFEWQATVLVPMVDIDLIEKKFNEVDLPEDVLERLNKIEFPLEFKNDGTYEEINITKGEFPFSSVYIATKRPSFVPTFENFNFSFEEKIVPVKVFWSFYNKPSIVIKVEREKKTVKDVMNLLNTTVLVNWPYLRPAQVVGIIDEKSLLSTSTKSIIPITDPGAFPAQSIHDTLLTTQGLELGSISVILTVNYQKSDGSFDTNNTYNVPLNLITHLNFKPEISLSMHPVSIERNPNVNEKVVFVNSTSSEICVGRIIEKKGQILNVHFIHREKFPIIQIMNEESKKWITFKEVVRTIGGISFRGIRQCLRKVVVDPFGVNIAFPLFSFDRRVLFGCCKHDKKENTHLFANFVVPLLIEYFKLTGSLKKLIMESISRNEKFLSKVTLEMLYGGTVEYQNECYEKLINWLSNNAPSLRYPVVDEENDFLSCESLSILEERIASFDFNESEDSQIRSMKSSDVIWKMKMNPNYNRSMPKIGQRVVSIAASGPAVFGETGTIVETVPSSNSVFVLFDRVLRCASRVEGVFNTNRGLRVNINDIIAFDE